MPAYEYQCNECGNHFERRQKMSDAPLSICPQCNGTVKRLISGGAGTICKGDRQLPAHCAEAGACGGFDAPCCGRGSVCGS